MDVLEQEMQSLSDLNQKSATNFNVYADQFIQQQQIKTADLYSVDINGADKQDTSVVFRERANDAAKQAKEYEDLALKIRQFRKKQVGAIDAVFRYNCIVVEKYTRANKGSQDTYLYLNDIITVCQDQLSQQLEETQTKKHQFLKYVGGRY